MIARLDEMGFIWDVRRYQGQRILLALRTYKSLYGDLYVRIISLAYCMLSFTNAFTTICPLSCLYPLTYLLSLRAPNQSLNCVLSHDIPLFSAL